MNDMRGRPSDRRASVRFALRPMYSGIEVKLASDATEQMSGHAYDISRGGVCFELDRAIDPGTPIFMRLTLPEWLQGLADGETDTAHVHIKGTVVWTDDDGVQGPVRMAAAFTSFDTIAERELFLRTLKSRLYASAA